MTPLLPTPDYYLHNNNHDDSESKRLPRRATKEHFNCHRVYCGGTYELQQLTIDHVRLNAEVEMKRRMSCLRRRCNQEKVVRIGWTG